MTAHYYTEEPTSEHERVEWAFVLAGKTFHFVTDRGVFSKKTVDYGSRVLIDQFNDQELPTGPLLDVGCGYGPIGLALAHKTGRPVELVDINQRAVALAQENSERNGIAQVKVYPSNLYERVETTNFAAIVSNPPIRAGKAVVHDILAGSYDRLAIGGQLVVVIQKKQGAPSAAKKMTEVFGNVTTLVKDKGYYVLASTKRA